MIDTQLLIDLVSTAEADGVQQLVVGAVIIHEERVLLLKRPGDDFMGGIHELPSGKVEPGEALEVGLAREVTEEAGLVVSAIGAYLGYFDYTSGSGKLSRQFTFVVEVETTEPVVLTEHDEFTWAPLEEELPVTDAVNAVLNTYTATR
ncbi:NUDIX hydrolase [Actinokineospora cianjurensis]|uniref:8-oxo-dGTP diphosphatase n=1 Tax=Actinokineospora cianjurensis TaxID=585224 RepID=A0A421B3C7_9PSEU|nr:NUDIX domain-containing protein [Actinokineospora cianjurensis]RLK58778.1 8-oxo-dGTP diphosphatase [Actinokineospora cianjurensis]